MQRPKALVSSFAFALTGIGTALLGSTLPATLQQWHLTDSRGGLLLFAAWGGATAGALFARENLERSAAAGLALSAVALLALSATHHPALGLLYLLYGIGLGTTMTSLSLLRSRGVPAAQADLELNRLNLLWAAGACFAPALALHSLHLLSVATLFRFAAGTFALAAVATLAVSLLGDAGTPVSPVQAGLMSIQRPWAPLRFGLFAAAAVGMESAVGSWLTTYAARSTYTIGSAVSANAAFWGGLLLSRALHSVKTAGWVHTAITRALHITVVGLAMLLLLLHPNRSILAAAGLLCGFGLGPLYPYALSVALPRYRSTAVFVLAGVGASVVPWLTGVLSSALGSLRLGLLASVLAFVLLVIAAVAMRSDVA